MKLRVEDMAISFDNRRILEHVGFHVEEGEFTALIGPSGCGKSTLLNILAGLLHCEEGIFYVDDVQVTGVSSHFAYMPQDDLLLPWKNILDNVCLYGKLHGHINEAREKALQEFETFGLKGYELSLIHILFETSTFPLRLFVPYYTRISNFLQRKIKKGVDKL